ncbi:MAG: Cna B-type domain-containing protein, partial [Tissierellia bacterium]|nr:Cna B-type domain-containing protein [Tissierellia bacterium]
YRVEEVKVPGYTATTTGNAQNGFVITNKVETPPTTTPPTTTPPDTSPPDLPKTGDGINPSHLAMGGLSLGVGLIALGLWRRRYAH